MATTRVNRSVTTNHAPERKKRIPVSGVGRNILTIEEQDPNYVYRWVNDKDGRIQRFLDGWWEFAPKVGTGERSADSASDPSSRVSKKVGNGMTAYLMRIKREYYDEDQAAKAQHVNEIEESMFRDLSDKNPGMTGKVTFERK